MHRRSLVAFGIVLVVLAAFTATDLLVFDDLIPNDGPQLVAYDLLKAFASAVLALMLVFGIYADGRSIRAPETPDVAMPILVVASYALAAAFVALFLISPTAFNWLGSEDNVLEYASAVLCLAGSAMFLGVLRVTRGGVRIVAGVAAVGLFLIAMEEISWGQRIFGFGTPESFAGNAQGEVNLHNFLTTPIHTVYRIGSWLVLIFLPFLASFGPRSPLMERFDIYFPPPWLAAASVPVACFTFNAWPFMPTQATFFSTILMLALYWHHASRGGRSQAATLFAVGVVLAVAAQLAFLTGGDRYVRHWDVTEYQEFYMAAGLAALAWILRRNARLAHGSATRGPAAASPRALDAQRLPRASAR